MSPADITDILRHAAETGASDVILTVGMPPQFKTHLHKYLCSIRLGPRSPGD